MVTNAIAENTTRPAASESGEMSRRTSLINVNETLPTATANAIVKYAPRLTPAATSPGMGTSVEAGAGSGTEPDATGASGPAAALCCYRRDQ